MKRVRSVVIALLAVLWMAPLRAQEPSGTIRGRVIDDASKEPLASVTVTFGSHRAVTQADGRYILPGVPAGTDSVRARMLGFAPVAQSVTVGAGQVVVVDLAMTAQAIGLSEIVVVGYGEQRAGDITGAVQQLSVEDFNPGRVVSPEMLIQSKVAGVQVVDNNEPGGGIQIRIRGATSVNASSNPLYVIDGMPVGNNGGLSAGRDPLNFLNPNEIESITVLKDASSAAIYGANAANGVVLITTKSGSAAGGHRGTQVEYTTSASAASVSRVPTVLNAAQFTAAVQAQAPGKAASLGTANTNWFNLVDRTGYGQEQNLSVTNTGENTFYRLSLGYLDQQGVLQGSSTQRLSLGFNYDQHLFGDQLGIKANVKGSRTFDQFQAGDVIGNAISMAPTQPVYDPTNPTGYWDWSGTGASASNPVASLNRSIDHGTTLRSVGNFQADYKVPFLEGLKADVNLGYDLAQANRQQFIPNDLRSQKIQGQGYLSLAENSTASAELDAYLNYAAPLTFAPGRIDVTAGYSYAQSHSESPYFNATGLSSNLLGISGVPTVANPNPSNFVVDYKLISFFGRFNYNLNDRYLVAASLRRDGSSRFGPDNQWGYFPSVSLAWRLSQEPFLKDITALSDLKLRASWAKTGNQAIGDYLQYPTYSYSNAQAQYQLGNSFVTTIRPSAVDTKIHWETTKSYNVGLDYAFFNSRISGAIDWYTKNTSDLLFYVPVDPATNFSNFLTTNIGTMKNTGIELSLNAAVLQSHSNGLSYTASFTVAHNANKLLTINPADSTTLINVGGISGGVGSTVEVLKPGEPINSFYVYQARYGANGRPVSTGPDTAMYVDRNGDHQINDADRRPFHSPWPSLQLGHTSNLTYGNFDFSFTLRAELGNYVYNNVASNNGSYQNITAGNVTPTNMDVSVLRNGYLVPQYLSDVYVEDASFLRMDNVTLGYSFNWSGHRLRLYATVQNAFTITGYNGVDPTAGLNGIDNNIYPRSRTFTGGLSVRF